MTFPIESEGLDIVAEDEPVLAAAGIFNLVIQASQLAFIGIKLPFADKGIVGRERAGGHNAEECKENCEASIHKWSPVEAGCEWLRLVLGDRGIAVNIYRPVLSSIVRDQEETAFDLKQLHWNSTGLTSRVSGATGLASLRRIPFSVTRELENNPCESNSNRTLRVMLIYVTHVYHAEESAMAITVSVGPIG